MLNNFIVAHRIILKAITYRFLAVVTAVLITLSFGIDVRTSIKLTVVINVLHTVLFFYHELAWKYIKRQLRKNQ